MRQRLFAFSSNHLSFLSVLLIVLAFPGLCYGQASFTAQVRGTVKDVSGAMIPGATVTITADETQVAETVTTDREGRYLFPSLRPTSYTIRVEAAGFKTAIRPGVVLRVSQQVDLDFTLAVGEITATVEITSETPLLNSVGAGLGAEVTNRYIVDMPLLDRSIVNLAYLAPGVTEVEGSGISFWGGTNFVSNGQRNGTAEMRLDGALSSAPEGGEGGNTVAMYQPTVEFVQEFKLQNNSFSAEFGNNGGTVINIVTKSGSNDWHGSGYYFFRRPAFDANDFFANRAGEGKADYARDQYGGSLGGPIKKNKTFFFADFEITRNNYPNSLVTTVPTELQRNGDFSQTFNDDGSLQAIYNPFSTTTDAEGNVFRDPFPDNKIPSTLFDAVGANTVKLYPEPNQEGDPVTGRYNYYEKFVSNASDKQFDIKIDQNISPKQRLSGRFSGRHSEYTNPSSFLAGTTSGENAYNAVLDYNWTPTSIDLLTLRLGADRFHLLGSMEERDPVQSGYDPFLTSVHGLKRFPTTEADGYETLAAECCADTMEAHTQWNYSASFSRFFHGHNLKFGGEQRIPLMAYFQPDTPTGYFIYSRETTMQDVFNTDDTQGNSVASMLLGWPVSGYLGGQPSTIDKSKDTGFYIQDDWKVNQRLTLNMGLRYEWSTPFNERFDRLQWPDFEGDTGVDIPGLGHLKGTTIFAGENGKRSVSPDFNNFGPRLGFAYRINDKTVLRGGAGIYYGFNNATNYQYVGSAFYKGYNMTFSKDGNITRYATLNNVFPDGVAGPEGKEHGKNARWGFSNSSPIDESFRNAEIYQWNFGVQRELPGDMLLEVNYSASRSTHLPWGSARNRNYVSREAREEWGRRGLRELVPNPFQPLFSGPDAIYNAPDSIYNDEEIQRVYILRPYPQFAGGFSGIAIPAATARYNALQVRFEKRYSYGLNFTGNYTFSKLKDDSSLGSNIWVLTNDEGIGNVQDLTDRRPDWGVGYSDTPHRFVVAASYDLPFGKGRQFGGNVSRGVDYLIGGWKFNSFVTFQSGNPIAIRMDFNRLQDGSQRPNVTGDPRGASIQDVVDGKGNYFNEDALSDPGDQIAGSAPRYFDNVRTQGIKNLDFSIFKSFQIREGMQVAIHAEFFNFTNTPRFGRPGYWYGSDDFGKINSTANGPRRGQIGIRFVF